MTPFRDATAVEGDTMQMVSRYLAEKQNNMTFERYIHIKKEKNIKSPNSLFQP